ncbi:hypothetical protein K470DRAFT_209277 [Piedraia hortae CBS 480.64]|uniref:Type 1 phosphatases regulator n=1 Tax=Piedraia hortae CBS 480.64 TaxID=1314780 RepID=A0A6A7C9N5_9PEZI|nr:hypothetical protein K470DRAFT_209277 [Piedraia hortae CBS 480.64]
MSRQITRTSTPVASSGSQTIVQAGPSTAPTATLRLRANAEPDDTPHVRWDDSVVDNEGMGKKSSKVCCIYHKPHEPGDSESETSSSDSDDSSEGEDLSRAQRAGNGGRKPKKNTKREDDKGKAKERRPSPNAYERQPKHSSNKQTG